MRNIFGSGRKHTHYMIAVRLWLRQIRGYACMATCIFEYICWIYVFKYIYSNHSKGCWALFKIHLQHYVPSPSISTRFGTQLHCVQPSFDLVYPAHNVVSVHMQWSVSAHANDVVHFNRVFIRHHEAGLQVGDDVWAVYGWANNGTEYPDGRLHENRVLKYSLLFLSTNI